MAKFKVFIRRVEYYSMSVVVDAENIEEATAKTQKEYLEEDYLFESITDFLDDASTEFVGCGLASEQDINQFINI